MKDKNTDTTAASFKLMIKQHYKHTTVLQNKADKNSKKAIIGKCKTKSLIMPRGGRNKYINNK